jgi:hypothetical protein
MDAQMDGHHCASDVERHVLNGVECVDAPCAVDDRGVGPADLDDDGEYSGRCVTRPVPTQRTELFPTRLASS